MILAIADLSGISERDLERVVEVFERYGFKRSLLRRKHGDFETLIRLPKGVFVMDSPVFSNDVPRKITKELLDNDLLVPVVFLSVSLLKGYMFTWGEESG